MDQRVHLTPRLAELALISAELSASNQTHCVTCQRPCTIAAHVAMATGGQEWRGGGKKARGEEERKREKATTLDMIQTKTACDRDTGEGLFSCEKVHCNAKDK